MHRLGFLEWVLEIMSNGTNIISEEDFIAAPSDTARGWTHRMLTEIYDQNKLGEAVHVEIIEKLDKSIEFGLQCPGRNYRPVVDKVIVGVMGLLGGMIAVFIAIKAKVFALVDHIP